jgi:DNA-binding NtrC family response regulator
MPPTLEGRTILIVEDEVLIADLFGDELRDLGGKTIVSTQLHEALELSKTAHIHGAIVDYALKDGKTQDLCAMLSSRRIPYIVYSGFGDLVQFPKEAVVIQKPTPVRDVIQKLTELLSQPAS